MGQDGEVALFQIADVVGEGRQRDGVGAEIHLALAFADRQRAAAPGADQKVLVAVEQEAQREGAFQALQHGVDGVLGRLAALQLARHQMGDRLRVGLAFEDDALGFQLGAQLAVVLDDAVVDDRQPRRRMRMGIGLCRRAMGRPAGVADADRALQRMVGEPCCEVDQLALGAQARQRPVFQRGDAGGIIAAIFEPLQRVDETVGHLFAADDADNSAHGLVPGLAG